MSSTAKTQPAAVAAAVAVGGSGGDGPAATAVAAHRPAAVVAVAGSRLRWCTLLLAVQYRDTAPSGHCLTVILVSVCLSTAPASLSCRQRLSSNSGSPQEAPPARRQEPALPGALGSGEYSQPLSSWLPGHTAAAPALGHQRQAVLAVHLTSPSGVFHFFPLCAPPHNNTPSCCNTTALVICQHNLPGTEYLTHAACGLLALSRGIFLACRRSWRHSKSL